MVNPDSVDPQLREMCSDLFKVPDYQKGFTLGESTYSNVVTMLETILPQT